ncbi:helix-turn-helix domain-containing protein [Streptomyces sp. NPDC006692]|uniref:helix-turn-helix domain-containing protein n=1 Tax=Streptomyces sp. NPDC006692 TaxID=3364758 RepID=UPI0036B4E47C
MAAAPASPRRGALAAPRHATALDKPVGQWLTTSGARTGLGQIAAKTGIPKTSLHRYLTDATSATLPRRP